MSVLFYEYAACSTCKKAKKWLESKKIIFKNIPIVEAPPSAKDLKQYYENSGLDIKKFFNTSGLSYRALGLSSKINSLSVNECLQLLAKDGKLIKRPLLVKGKTVLVGFKEEDYKNLLKQVKK
jgi:arsenate reductase (glutaredoxin)